MGDTTSEESHCCCWRNINPVTFCVLFCGGILVFVVYAFWCTGDPPSFNYVFTEMYEGKFTTDVKQPDHLCATSKSLEKTHPELLEPYEKELCSTLHDRSLFGTDWTSHPESHWSQQTDIPLFVDTTEHEDSLELREHMRDLAQTMGDVIGKTYRLVDHEECETLGTTEHGGTCQPVRFQEYDESDYVYWGFYDRSVDKDIILNPSNSVMGPGNEAKRDEVYLHELGHSLGLTHSRVKGALMTQQRNGEADRPGAVLAPQDKNRLTALYARTSIADRLAQAQN